MRKPVEPAEVKLLNKTDMILLQKEIERLGRETFSSIIKVKPGTSEENEIILNWCFASICAMLSKTSPEATKDIGRRVQGFVEEKTASGSHAGGDGPQIESYLDLEMTQQQEEIDSLLYKIRALIALKTKESDELIEQCGQ